MFFRIKFKKKEEDMIDWILSHLTPYDATKLALAGMIGVIFVYQFIKVFIFKK